MEDEFYFEDFQHYSSSSHSYLSVSAGISEAQTFAFSTEEQSGVGTIAAQELSVVSAAGSPVEEVGESSVLFGASNSLALDEDRPTFSVAGKSLPYIEAEEVPAQTVFLQSYLQRLLNSALGYVEMFAQTRRNHQKFRDDPPSNLKQPIPEELRQAPEPLATAKLAIEQVKASFRSTVFALPDFRNVSTSTLRHACMGVLADSYRIYLRFNADLDTVSQELYEACDSDLTAKLAFLECIERHPQLPEVCQYCVTSKATSTAKGVLRKIYLDLLALRHNTTPTLAQELVPGFTYDYIALDEVVQLVEQDSTPSVDQEVERFRQALLKAKPAEPKVQVVLSDQFLAKVEARLKGAKTSRA